MGSSSPFTNLDLSSLYSSVSQQYGPKPADNEIDGERRSRIHQHADTLFGTGITSRDEDLVISSRVNPLGSATPEQVNAERRKYALSWYMASKQGAMPDEVVSDFDNRLKVTFGERSVDEAYDFALADMGYQSDSLSSVAASRADSESAAKRPGPFGRLLQNVAGTADQPQGVGDSVIDSAWNAYLNSSGWGAVGAIKGMIGKDPGAKEKYQGAFRRSLAQSAVTNTYGALDGAMSTLGMDSSAAKVRMYERRIMNRIQQDPEIIKELKDTSGTLANFSNPAWWAVNGGQTVGNVGAMTVAALPGVGVAAWATKGRTMSAMLRGTINSVSAGVSAGVHESAVNAGDAASQAEDEVRGLRELMDKIKAMPQEKIDAYVKSSEFMAIKDFKEVSEHFGDPSYAARIASETFKKNIFLNAVFESASMGAGRAIGAGLKAVGGRESVKAAAKVIGGMSTEAVTEIEQEIRQDDITAGVIAETLHGVAYDAGWLTPHIIGVLTDPQKADTAMATLLQVGSHTPVQVIADTLHVKSIADAERKIRETEKRLADKVAAGNATGSDMETLKVLQSKSTFEDKLAAVNELAKRDYRNEFAKSAGQTVVDPTVKSELDSTLDAVSSDMASMESTVEPVAGDSGVTPTVDAPADTSAPVAKVRAILDGLREQFPESPAFQVVTSAEIPESVRSLVPGKRINAYYADDGSYVLVADAIGSDSEVVAKWAHEVSHGGLKVLFANEPGRLDAVLSIVADSIDQKVLQSLYDKTGMTAEEIEMDPHLARRRAAEEYIARIAEKIGREGMDKLSAPEKTAWEVVLDAVRQWMAGVFHKAGVPMTLTEKQIEQIAIKAMAANGVRAKSAPVKARRGGFSSIKMGSDENPMPLAFYVAEHKGGIIGKGAATKRGDKIGRSTEGDYDGYPTMAEIAPFAGRLLSGTIAPDVMAQMAYDNGLIPEPTTNALWDGLRGEVAAWRRQNKTLKEQVASEEQSKRFQSEVVGNDLASEAVTMSQLKVGDSMVVNSEELKVVDFDQDYGMFILDGGKRYGQQSLTPDTTLYVEKVNYAPEGGAVDVGGGVAFSAEDMPSDAEYLAAVKSGDMETAQRLVDAAAKAAGYLPLFHGTTKVGQVGIWSTGKLKSAGEPAVYLSTHSDLQGYGDGTVMRLAVKEDHVEIDDEFPSGRQDYRVDVGRPKGSVQVKSADPVTYDDAGNVIPLSKRFNQRSNDIRFSVADRNLPPSDLPDHLAEAVVATNGVTLKNQPRYNEAKKLGDYDGAVEVVSSIIKSSTISAIRSRLHGDAPVYIVPVINQEELATAENQLPIAMARFIASWLNATVLTKVYKSKTGATKLNARERAIVDNGYGGDIPAVGQFVLVDDMLTTGNTLYGLYDVIASNGGDVRAFVAGAQTRGAGIRASQEDLDAMHKKSGLDSSEVADILGRHEGYLTGQEVRHYNLTGGRGPSGFAKRFANGGKLRGELAPDGLWSSDLGTEAGGEGYQAGSRLAPPVDHSIQGTLDFGGDAPATGSIFKHERPKHTPGLPGFRLSSSDIDVTDHVLGEREKVLAAAAAARLVAGKDVTPGRIRTMLAGIGLDTGAADAVLKQARAIASEVQRDNLKLANDAEIMEAVTVAAVKGKYRENIRTTAGTATENANRLAEALAKINDWRKHRQEQLAAARGGVGYADIAVQDSALAGLHERLPSIVSDYVPKPKPTKEEETQDGGEESARGGVRSDDAEETPETPTDAFEFPDRAAADQEAEASALAPIPSELPTEPVAIAKLKDAIKAAVRENLKKIGYTARNESTDPVFRREYAESWARVLRDAAWANIKAGRLQAWITEELTVLAKTPGNTSSIDKRVSQLAYWIGRATEKAQAETLFARIEKLLKLKAVKTKPSTTKEYIKRDIDPHFHSWLRLVKSVITTRTEGGSPHYTTAEDRESLLQHLTSIGRQWSTGTIEEDAARDMLARLVSPMVASDPMLQSMDVDDLLNIVTRAVSAYAGAKYMKPAELATALDTLQADYESGIKKILDAREERRKRLDPTEESMRSGVLALKEKQDGIITSFIRGQFSFYRGMLDLVRQAEGESYDKAAASIRDLSVRIDAVIGEKDSRVAADVKWLHDQVKDVYGLTADKDVETKLRELKEERDDYKRFSLVDNKGKELRLTKANLLSIVAMLQQAHGAEMGLMHGKRASRGVRDSAYLSSILAELTAQDMELLNRLRGWYRDNRAELSSMSEAVTGIPVTAPDPLYHPIVADRDDAHLAEFHFVLNLVPSALETRRKHKWDIKEGVDIFDTFFKYSDANAQFIAGSQLGQDLRFLFGNPKMRRALTESAGKQTASALITHVTEIAAGRPINNSVEEVAGMMSSVRAMTTYAAMSGSVGSMIRQASAIPAFGYVIDEDRPMGAMTEAMTKAFTDPREWKKAYDIISQHPHFKTWARQGWSEQVHNAMTQNSKNPIVRMLRMGMAVPAVGIRASALAVAPGILLMRFNEYKRRGMGEEEAMKMALGEVFFAIHQTQGSSHIANLSAPMRGANEGTKLMMQFMGPVIQLLEPELNMIRNLTGSARSRRKGLNYLIIGHVLIPSAYQMANVIFKSMRGDYAGDDGDDEVKKSIIEWLAAMLIGPLSAVYFVGGALESLIRHGLGMQSYSDSIPVVSLTSKLGIGSFDMAKHLATFNYEEAVKDFDKIAKSFAAYRDVRKAVKNYDEASGD